MFEKEAKERAEKLEKEQTLGVYDNDEDLARDEGFNDGEVSGYEEGFNDGAEFAYNKALEQCDKKFAESNRKWQEILDKANEWHYVKYGKLPKTGNPCLVYLVNDCVIVARLREDNVWTTDGHNAFENVIAWKELPELPKESEE